jgi:hypothetical protein
LTVVPVVKSYGSLAVKAPAGEMLLAADTDLRITGESTLMSVWAWSKLVGVVRLTVSETVDPKQSSGPMVLTITTSQTRRSVCICVAPID